MFRKLRLQFILANLGIIFVLFVTLTAGVYTLLQLNMITHAEAFAEQFAQSINSGFRMFPESLADSADPADKPYASPGPPLPPLPPGNADLPMIPGPPRSRHERSKLLPPFFLVKTDSEGTVTFQTFRETETENERRRLVHQIFQSDKVSGLINGLDSKYFYYKAPLTEEAGVLMIFQDLKQEKTIQQSLVWSLTLIGIGYLMLGLASSIFMARRAVGPIEQAWQQQRKFLADASHELRTPLAVIQTNLDAALANPRATVASQMDWFDNVQEELRQMIALISSLLFLARVDAKQCVMKKTEISLDQVTLRVCERFQPIAAAQNIILSAAVEQVTCCGDESNLREVLGILLDNAIRHTAAGGEITMRLSQSGKKVTLVVSDTGEGIAAEHLDKIFDRFYQADASRSNGKAGLGLAIAKGIIENHGGTIRVTSAVGVGTSFTIQLPLHA